ncbi:(2Fe-2S) ferredoxin [Hypericibacter terrae]|uniref:(2Fe-2S) ferredoxin n=1 Tax=Hypericibacter terrae TaxID=2602015 RepID=A0A5J6MHR2_9PROT|nr:aromatic ring-hydroxylating dioxygenase subunit alpha [Hypericibacter terrae]QEX17058.1 (2Fe-2S) ferredoxin [Hypericibacter terrae]
MTLIVSTQDRPVPAPVVRQDKRFGPPETLPAWTYNNAEFFALEREHLLLNQWQLVCHQSEIRDAGSYATFDFLGERALVVRGEDGEIRAFHNVCRHRAAAVARGDFGRCEGAALRCFYHGWTYGLDGRLKAVPGEKQFPGLDKATHGLHPLPFEIWQGFVFVKFREGGPSIAERMAPYAAELDQYRIPEMEPRDKLYFIEVPVDWKNMMDNFLEGYHVPVGHPGLYRLFGNSYDLDVKPGDVSRAVAQLRDRPSPNWSERHYQRLLPDLDYLTPERQRAWTFYGLLPNIGFDIYPDQIDYFHAVPLGPGRCALRGRSYKLAGLPTDLERRLKACRYLSWRVNWPVFNEDNFLIESVQRGLESSSYEVGVLSEKEICVRQLHDQVRRHFPVAKLRRAPAPGTIAATNSAMLAASPAP